MLQVDPGDPDQGSGRIPSSTEETPGGQGGKGVRDTPSEEGGGAAKQGGSMMTIYGAVQVTFGVDLPISLECRNVPTLSKGCIQRWELFRPWHLSKRAVGKMMQAHFSPPKGGGLEPAQNRPIQTAVVKAGAGCSVVVHERERPFPVGRFHAQLSVPTGNSLAGKCSA